MTQTVTGAPVARETDARPRERQARRLAALVVLGLAVAGCAGSGQQTQRQDDVPFWHEEPENNPDAGGMGT